jgi:hypothetical protein
MSSERVNGYARWWARLAHAVFLMLALAAPAARAQVTNANVVEFLPSADHGRTLASGQPAVSRYQVEFYQRGSLDSVLSLSIGKPAPQADGMIRVDFAKLQQVVPLPNVVSEVRVAAIGPDGTGVSTVSNTFVQRCAWAVTPTTYSFSAGGSGSTATINVAAKCPWSAATSASWLKLSSTSGVGPGSFSITAAPNTQSAARTATVTVRDVTLTVRQSGQDDEGGGEIVKYLGDEPWTSMTNGWGPVERNRSNGSTGAADGRAITLAGRTYARGLGTHAASDVRFALGGQCSTLYADIGVDDEEGDDGSVVFQVSGDGATLYQSAVMRGSSTTQSITVDVRGRSQLALIVTDGGDGAGNDHADWADVRVLCNGAGAPPSATERFISDGAWTAISNGWGPAEKDRSNGETGASDGGPLTLAGVVYQKGLGVHASSEVRYPLAGKCSTFEAAVGVDDEMENRGSVVFEVLADGATVFNSGVMTGTTATRSLTVDVTGRQELVLKVTDGGDGLGSDHGDWADARVTCVD